MKKVILLTIVLFTLNSCPQAQSKKESIKVLFGFMHQDTLINKMFDAMTSSMLTSMTSQIKDTANSSKISNMMVKSMERSRSIAKKLINEDMVDIYDKYFTQQEIDDF